MKRMSLNIIREFAYCYEERKSQMIQSHVLVQN